LTSPPDGNPPPEKRSVAESARALVKPMNENLPPQRPVAGPNRAARMCPVPFAALAVVALFCSPLSAQTVITIANAGFESPPPSVFPDYTVGATGWTRTNATINAGTFAPGISGTAPAPVDGSQVGYADGFGGLQQVLTATFSANQLYTFSVSIGYRSDSANSPQGTGAISIGYLDPSGTFIALGEQSATVSRGQFNLVTGSTLATADALGQPVALRLSNLDSFQVLFDHTQLSFAPSAIPEPSAFAFAFSAGALGFAWFQRRSWMTRRRWSRG